MKIILLFSTIIFSSLAFAGEVLVCDVKVLVPNAQDLRFIGQKGTRLISEKYEPANGGYVWNTKLFTFTLEESGLRKAAIVSDLEKPIDSAPLNIDFRIGKFGGNPDLQILEVDFGITSLLDLNGSQISHRSDGSLLCYKQLSGAKRCVGNTSSSFEDFNQTKDQYFGYSIFCKPF